MHHSSEALFAQKLASNDKRTRDKAVRKLQKWIAAKTCSKRIGFNKLETLKIWKGLFYCMWMSDKPVIQQELAVSISNLIHAFGNSSSALLFVRCFFQTMSREWQGIDTWRINKYMNFVRKFLAQCFVFLERSRWQPEVVDKFLAILSKDVVGSTTDSVSIGLQLHLADIYIEELAKSAHSKLPPERLTCFFLPFCHGLASQQHGPLTETIVKRVFEFAIRLHDDDESDEGGDGEEEVADAADLKLLKSAGVREEVAEGEEEEDDEEEDLGMAGNWQRTLKKHELEARSIPFPKFDYKDIGDAIDKIAEDPATKYNRNTLKRLAKLYWKMSEGVFDLDDVRLPVGDSLETADYEESAQRLADEEDDFHRESKRLKRANYKMKKKGRRQAADSDDEATEMVDEDDLDDADFDGPDVSGQKLSKKRKLEPVEDVDRKKKKLKKSELQLDGTKKKKAKQSPQKVTVDEDELVDEVAETGDDVEKEEQQPAPIMDKLMLRLLAKAKQTESKAEVESAKKKKEKPAKEKPTKLKKNSQSAKKKSKPNPVIDPLAESDEEERIPALVPMVVDVEAESVGVSPSASVKVAKQNPRFIYLSSSESEDEVFHGLKIEATEESDDDLQIVYANRTAVAESVALSNGGGSCRKKVAEAPAPKRTPKIQAPGSALGSRLNSQTNRYFPADGASAKRKMQVSKVAAATSSEFVSAKMNGEGPPKAASGFLSLSCQEVLAAPPAAPTSTKKSQPIVQFEKVTSSTPAFFRVAASKVLSKTTPKTKALSPVVTETRVQSSKRVNFLLSKNVAQAHAEYIHSVKNSPSVPFDAGRTPSQGVLKVKAVQTFKLGNPFVRRKAMDFF